MQRAAEVFNGISLAFAKGDLPAAFFDSVAFLAEDAAAMAWRVNAERSRAAAKDN